MAVGYNDASGDSLMSISVQAQCPRCGKVVRFPAEWIEKPVRCKKGRAASYPRRRTEIGTEASASATVLPNGTQEPAPIIQLARPRQRRSWKVPVGVGLTLVLLLAVVWWNWDHIVPHWRDLRNTW